MKGFSADVMVFCFVNVIGPSTHHFRPSSREEATQKDRFIRRANCVPIVSLLLHRREWFFHDSTAAAPVNPG